MKFIESELVLLKKEIDEMWTWYIISSTVQVMPCLRWTGNWPSRYWCANACQCFELKIDSDVEDIIALYNPVAIDLRFVLAMLKINTNLERLGDFAEGIARFALNCKEPILASGLVKELRLEEMINQVSAMLELAKELFRKKVRNWQPRYSPKITCWMKSMQMPLLFWQIISASIPKVHSLV